MQNKLWKYIKIHHKYFFFNKIILDGSSIKQVYGMLKFYYQLDRIILYCFQILICCQILISSYEITLSNWNNFIELRYELFMISCMLFVKLSCFWHHFKMANVGYGTHNAKSWHWPCSSRTKKLVSPSNWIWSIGFISKNQSCLPA